MIMRRKSLTIGLLTMMMAASVAFGANGNDVQAATKLSVNRVYENATRITGKTRKKNTVKVKIGKKTYKAKANKKGKFTVKIPRVAAGKKYTLKSYKGKKLYKTKKVYVIAKSLKINPYTPNSRSISGYVRPAYKVKVTLNSKTYTKKADKNSGYWKVKPGAGKSVGTDVNIKVINTKGKVVKDAKKHQHDFEPVYKTVHHDEAGHYETVEVPAWDETVQRRHQVCFVCGRDKTQDFIDSINNKTYPQLPNEYFTIDDMKEQGWTEENGWPRYSSDLAIYKEMGVRPEDVKDVPPYGMYLASGGWDGQCDGHNYGSKTVEITVHHDETTKKEWKVDKKAYDEKVIVGYKCKCGASSKGHQ